MSFLELGLSRFSFSSTTTTPVPTANTTPQQRLFAACRAGSADDADAALLDGADVSLPSSEGETALHMACFNGNPRLCRVLIAAQAPLAALTPLGETPLHRAVLGGSTTVIPLLFPPGLSPTTPAGAALLSATDALGRSALFLAAELGRTPAVTALLELGADPAAADGRGGKTALWAALFCGHADVVRVLLEAGVPLVPTLTPSPSPAPASAAHSANAGCSVGADHWAAGLPDTASPASAAFGDTVAAIASSGSSRSEEEDQERSKSDDRLALGLPHSSSLSVSVTQHDIPCEISNEWSVIGADAPAPVQSPLPTVSTSAAAADPHSSSLSQHPVSSSAHPVVSTAAHPAKPMTLPPGYHASCARPLIAAVKSGSATTVSLVLQATAGDVQLALADTGACDDDMDVHGEAGSSVDLDVGVFPLWAAVDSGSAEVVSLLLEWKADIHQMHPRSHATVLHHAASLRRRHHLLPLLLHAGANVDARDRMGRTPLHAAAAVTHKIERAVVTELVKAGADPLAEDTIGLTALGLARDLGVGVGMGVAGAGMSVGGKGWEALLDATKSALQKRREQGARDAKAAASAMMIEAGKEPEVRPSGVA